MYARCKAGQFSSNIWLILLTCVCVITVLLDLRLGEICESNFPCVYLTVATTGAYYMYYTIQTYIHVHNTFSKLYKLEDNDTRQCGTIALSTYSTLYVHTQVLVLIRMWVVGFGYTCSINAESAIYSAMGLGGPAMGRTFTCRACNDLVEYRHHYMTSYM